MAPAATVVLMHCSDNMLRLVEVGEEVKIKRCFKVQKALSIHNSFTKVTAIAGLPGYDGKFAIATDDKCVRCSTVADLMKVDEYRPTKPAQSVGGERR